ncbi:MAG: hypothetical protein WCC22_05935 [Terriglobales bacterium]
MGTVKMILGLAVMVAMFIVGWAIVPAYFNNYEFEDALKNEALQATYSTRSEEDIREAVVKRAHDYDIPLTAKQVHVSRSGTYGNGSLLIETSYSVPVNLPGYQTTLEFHPSTKNKGVF